jgi:hypothetical protein
MQSFAETASVVRPLCHPFSPYMVPCYRHPLDSDHPVDGYDKADSGDSWLCSKLAFALAPQQRG